jgi:acyl carrier protein
VSRGGENAAARARSERWRALGARIAIHRADVANESDVAAVLASIASRGQRVSGVVHAAGLLDDATLVDLDDRKLQSVFAPKVLGAWNLHRLTADQPLDFFVFFSSVAAFIGLPGQGNYAAANAWLDGLAAHRRAMGLPAISIGWGPWSEVGLAAASENRGERLSGSGLRSMPPLVGVAAFGQILDANPAHAAVMSFDFDAWAKTYPSARTAPLFAELAPAARVAPEGGTSLSEDLLALPAGRSRRAHMESYLQQQVAKVLKLTPARIDVTKPLRTMGLDSLMALELRNRLESATKASVPATVIWNYPTIGQLAPEIASRMGIALEQQGTPAAANDSGEPDAGTSAVDVLLGEIEGMSDEDVRRMLAEEA